MWVLAFCFPHVNKEWRLGGVAWPNWGEKKVGKKLCGVNVILMAAFLG